MIRESIEAQLLLYAQRCRSAEELCAMAADRIVGVPITVVPMLQLPPDVPGASIQKGDRFFILYKPTYPLSIQLSILHELVHICLGHLDGVDTDIHAALSGNTIFTAPQERIAERMAHQLMACMKGQTEENEVSARFARLMPKKPCVWRGQNVADSRIALRYQALMPQHQMKRNTSRKGIFTQKSADRLPPTEVHD